HKAAALKPMPHQQAGFHFAEHGGDRGISQVAFPGERLVHVGHSGFAVFPQHLQYFELEVPETMDVSFAHGSESYCGNTTTVVDKVNPPSEQEEFRSKNWDAGRYWRPS